MVVSPSVATTHSSYGSCIWKEIKIGLKMEEELRKKLRLLSYREVQKLIREKDIRPRSGKKHELVERLLAHKRSGKNPKPHNGNLIEERAHETSLVKSKQSGKKSYTKKELDQIVRDAGGWKALGVRSSDYRKKADLYEFLESKNLLQDEVRRTEKARGKRSSKTTKRGSTSAMVKPANEKKVALEVKKTIDYKKRLEELNGPFFNSVKSIINAIPDVRRLLPKSETYKGALGPWNPWKELLEEFERLGALILHDDEYDKLLDYAQRIPETSLYLTILEGQEDPLFEERLQTFVQTLPLFSYLLTRDHQVFLALMVQYDHSWIFETSVSIGERGRGRIIIKGKGLTKYLLEHAKSAKVLTFLLFKDIAWHTTEEYAEKLLMYELTINRGTKPTRHYTSIIEIGYRVGASYLEELFPVKDFKEEYSDSIGRARWSKGSSIPYVHWLIDFHRRNPQFSFFPKLPRMLALINNYELVEDAYRLLVDRFLAVRDPDDPLIEYPLYVKFVAILIEQSTRSDSDETIRGVLDFHAGKYDFPYKDLGEGIRGTIGTYEPQPYATNRAPYAKSILLAEMPFFYAIQLALYISFTESSVKIIHLLEQFIDPWLSVRTEFSVLVHNNTIFKYDTEREKAFTEATIPVFPWGSVDSTRTKWRLAQQAISNRNIPILEELFSRELVLASDFNIAEIYKRHFAGGIVEFLVKKGADIDARTRPNARVLDSRGIYEETALMLVRNSNLARFLVKNGAKINLQNSKGQTALMVMEYWHKYTSSGDVVPILIENGADTDIKDNDGNGVAYYRELGDRMGPPV